MPALFGTDILLAHVSLSSGDWLLGYIDPGAGSILLQALVAGLAGCAVLVSMFWRKIRGFFASLLGQKPPPAPDAKTDSAE